MSALNRDVEDWKVDRHGASHFVPAGAGLEAGTAQAFSCSTVRSITLLGALVGTWLGRLLGT